MMTRIKDYTRAVVSGYSEVVFLQGFLPGMILLVGTFTNPKVGLSGIVCVFSAYAFSLLIGVKRDFLETGFYTYNPLLVSLSIGFLFKITPLTFSFMMAAGVLTFVLTFTLSHVLHRFFLLPVLSVPFVIISSLCCLAAWSEAGLFAPGLTGGEVFPGIEDHVPLCVAGFARALGALFLTPRVTTGLLFALVLLCASRILFFLAVGEYFLGTAITAALTDSLAQAFADICAFNYMLIAIALGGVFLVPSPRSYLTALIAVMVSPLLLESVRSFWSYYGIPVFTIPFNVVTLSFVYFLRLVEFPYLTSYFRGTPEKILDQHLCMRLRYPGNIRCVGLPFAGRWVVWQGRNGRWTHKGIWQHAFDFIVTDEEGGTYRNDSSALEDYYSFRKPILAPVAGRVVCAVSDVPDNPPGETERENNWGNTFIIHDERGFYVRLAHLARGSVECREGQWVEKVQLVGLCGNSGYSPQPHLHLQVQTNPARNAATLPFSFVSYRDGNGQELSFRSNDVPDVGSAVIPLHADRALSRRLTFLLDDEMTFRIEAGGRVTEETLRVIMAPSGIFCFSTEKAKLFFEKKDGTYYHYQMDGDSPALRALFLALPRAPLAVEEGLTWSDFLPLEAAMGRVLRGVALFLSSFHHGLFRVRGSYRFTGADEIQGEVTIPINGHRLQTRLTLDRFKGFASVQITGAGWDIDLTRTA